MTSYTIKIKFVDQNIVIYLSGNYLPIIVYKLETQGPFTPKLKKYIPTFLRDNV